MAKDNRELSLVNSNAYVTFLLNRLINNGSCGGHQDLGKLIYVRDYQMYTHN